jgi:hypothetical protein
MASIVKSAMTSKIKKMRKISRVPLPIKLLPRFFQRWESPKSPSYRIFSL